MGTMVKFTTPARLARVLSGFQTLEYHSVRGSLWFVVRMSECLLRGQLRRCPLEEVANSGC